MNIGCIYKITNPNGKVYIGSTKHENAEKRWIHYKNLNCKTQVKIYNSLNKYGPNNHTFEIIWKGNVLNLFEKEVYYGMLYNVLDKEKGLNLRLPRHGEYPTFVSDETKLKMSNSLKGKKRIFSNKNHRGTFKIGFKQTDEVKRKISEARKGIKMSEQQKIDISNSTLTKVIVYQYDLNKNFLNKFISIKEASLKTNSKASGISRCINNKQKIANNYIWSKIDIRGCVVSS